MHKAKGLIKNLKTQKEVDNTIKNYVRYLNGHLTKENIHMEKQQIKASSTSILMDRIVAVKNEAASHTK